jgi:hypothetical protein
MKPHALGLVEMLLLGCIVSYSIYAEGTLTVSAISDRPSLIFTEEEAVNFDAAFDPEKKDWWTYSEIIFASDEYFMDAYAVSFEIKSIHQDGAKSFKHFLVQFVSKNKILGAERTYRGVYYKPAEDWQKVTINLQSELPAALKPEDLKAIRIGAGPTKPQVAYWVKNVTVYFNRYKGWNI